MANGRSVCGSAIRRARVSHSCLFLIPVDEAEGVSSDGAMAIRFMMKFIAGVGG